MHGGSALELGRRDRDGSGGARCTVEVRWSWDEGTVMVAGGARCSVEVRWSWDEGTVMVLKKHGARWKCTVVGMKGP